MPMGIVVDQLVKEYPGKLALKGVSFEIKDKRIHGFLGPNGAGKSTAMNIICGLARQNNGRVLVNGLDTLDSREECRKRIGFLPEVPPLYEDMTVKDFLVFAARIRGVTKTEAENRADEIIEKHSLSSVATRRISVLSKGFKQRVAISSCLVFDPDILILDEPTVGLDPEAIREIRNLILELKDRHTILVSSHQLGEISKICDDLTIIKDGQIVISDTFENVMSSKVETGSFDGEPEKVLKAEENLYFLKVVSHKMKTTKEFKDEVNNLISIKEMHSEETDSRFIFEVVFLPKFQSQNDFLKHLIENEYEVLGLQKKEIDLEEKFLGFMGNSENSKNKEDQL